MGILDAPAVTASTFKKPRRRDLPGLGGLPAVMASPYTVTSATTSAGSSLTTGSAIASAQLIRPFNVGAFRYTGAKPNRNVFAGSVLAAISAGTYATTTSTSPWEVEFTLDTVGGAFDILSRDAVDSKFRLLVDGLAVTKWLTAKAPGSGGGTVRHAVTGLAAGVHRVRIEGTAGFYFAGVVVGPTDTVYDIPRNQLRAVAIGDSFTEPTVVDSRTDLIERGWPQVLQHLTGWDVWSAGSGGTGYLNPGTGGRVTFRTRAPGVIAAAAPDIILWAGGINDAGRSLATDTGAEAALCFQAARAAAPNALQVVLGPFWSRDPKQYTTGSTGVISTRDQIKAAALANGCLFLDMLEAPATGFSTAAGTMTSASAVNATSILATVKPDDGTLLRIGTGDTAEYRRVSSSSGASSPYTLQVQDGGTSLSLAHASGEAVVPTGPGVFTGTGQLGTPAGTGTADRYRGTDGTHPTDEGHLAIACWVYECLAAQLNP